MLKKMLLILLYIIILKNQIRTKSPLLGFFISNQFQVKQLVLKCQNSIQTAFNFSFLFFYLNHFVFFKCFNFIIHLCNPYTEMFKHCHAIFFVHLNSPLIYFIHWRSYGPDMPYFLLISRSAFEMYGSFPHEA